MLIAALGAIFCVAIISNADAIEGGDSVNYLDWALRITYIAMFLCIGLALLFGLYYFVTNIRKSKGMLFALVAFAVVMIISYAMADNTVTAAWAADGITENISKLSSAGLWATLLLLGIAVVIALWSEVTSIFK